MKTTNPNQKEPQQWNVSPFENNNIEYRYDIILPSPVYSLTNLDILHFVLGDLSRFDINVLYFVKGGYIGSENYTISPREEWQQVGLLKTV